MVPPLCTKKNLWEGAIRAASGSIPSVAGSSEARGDLDTMLDAWSESSLDIFTFLNKLRLNLETGYSIIAAASDGGKRENAGHQLRDVWALLRHWGIHTSPWGLCLDCVLEEKFQQSTDCPCEKHLASSSRKRKINHIADDTFRRAIARLCTSSSDSNG